MSTKQNDIINEQRAELEYKCEKCADTLSFGIWKYSMNQFGESLCIDCQKKARTEKYPEKLSAFLNKNLNYR